MKQLKVFRHCAEIGIQVRQVSSCTDRGVNVCTIFQRKEDEAIGNTLHLCCARWKTSFTVGTLKLAKSLNEQKSVESQSVILITSFAFSSLEDSTVWVLKADGDSPHSVYWRCQLPLLPFPQPCHHPPWGCHGMTRYATIKLCARLLPLAIGRRVMS
jgi:hypothetical protein